MARGLTRIPNLQLGLFAVLVLLVAAHIGEVRGIPSCLNRGFFDLMASKCKCQEGFKGDHCEVSPVNETQAAEAADARYRLNKQHEAVSAYSRALHQHHDESTLHARPLEASVLLGDSLALNVPVPSGTPECQHGGQWDPFQQRCLCPDGYTGDSCQSYSQCGTFGFLSANGSSCECQYGWTGPTCRIPPKCFNNGTWIPEIQTCSCWKGFSGHQCEVRPCDYGVYDKTTNVCVCAPGYRGARCDSTNPSCVNGQWDQDSGKCACQSGWTGEACERPSVLDLCPFGVYSVQTNSCICAAGYELDETGTCVMVSSSLNKNMIPGATLLGAGYDGRSACKFEGCRKADILKFTYTNGLRVKIGDTIYDIPDQVSLEPIFETRGLTQVWSGTQDYMQSLAYSAGLSGSADVKMDGLTGLFSGSASARFSIMGNGMSDNYLAQRKLSIVHYSLRLNSFGSNCADAFVQSFCDAVDALPNEYMTNPEAYVNFYEKWGAFFVREVNIGGTLEININILDSTAGMKVYWAEQVELAFKVEFFATASENAGANVSYESSSSSKRMSASVLANGGNPSIGITIVDLGHNMRLADQVQEWIDSISSYPRNVDLVPKLSSISSLILDNPTKKSAFDFALSVYLVDPSAGLRSFTVPPLSEGLQGVPSMWSNLAVLEWLDKQGLSRYRSVVESLRYDGQSMCDPRNNAAIEAATKSTEAFKSDPDGNARRLLDVVTQLQQSCNVSWGASRIIEWRNYYRFSMNGSDRCIRFAARFAGSFSVAFSSNPSRPETWYLLTVDLNKAVIQARNEPNPAGVTTNSECVGSGTSIIFDQYSFCKAMGLNSGKETHLIYVKNGRVCLDIIDSGWDVGSFLYGVGPGTDTVEINQLEASSSFSCEWMKVMAQQPAPQVKSVSPLFNLNPLQRMNVTIRGSGFAQGACGRTTVTVGGGPATVTYVEIGTLLVEMPDIRTASQFLATDTTLLRIVLNHQFPESATQHVYETYFNLRCPLGDDNKLCSGFSCSELDEKAGCLCPNETYGSACRRCVRNVENCIQYNCTSASNSVCLACADGFYVNSTTGQCHHCLEGSTEEECLAICNEGSGCKNGGVCVKNVCNCLGTWQGADCSVPKCTEVCQNGGTCVSSASTNQSSCQCIDGWGGNACMLPPCLEMLSVNEGVTCCKKYGNGETVKCFGDNFAFRLSVTTLDGLHGQLIDKGTSDYKSLGRNRAATHQCFVNSAGRARCFGQNSKGQLGTNNCGNTNQGALEGDIGLPDTDIAIEVATGWYRTCVLLQGGVVKCLGVPYSVVKETATFNNEWCSPTTVPLGGQAVQISISHIHACALLADGTVNCWGQPNSAASGALGGGNLEPTTAVVTVVSNYKFSRISLGEDWACAITKGSKGVMCWGSNRYGSLGNTSVPYGSIENVSPVPIFVSDLHHGVKDLATATMAGCALLETGVVKCWGYQMRNSLGVPSVVDQGVMLTPVAVLPNVISISCSIWTCCATVLPYGQLMCWGWNLLGQLGDGTTLARSTPVVASVVQCHPRS